MADISLLSLRPADLKEEFLKQVLDYEKAKPITLLQSLGNEGLWKGVLLVGVGAEDAGRRDKQVAADCAIDRLAKITCHS